MRNRKHAFAIALLFVCFTNISFSQTGSSADKAKKPFTLQLKITGFTNGYVRLFGVYGDHTYGIDSIFIDASGTATVKRDTGLSPGLYFISFPDQAMAQMLIDKDRQVTMEFSKSNIIGSMKTTGSPDNELLYKSLKFESVIDKRIDSAQKLIKKAEKEGSPVDSLQEQLQRLKSERKNNVTLLAKNYPDNFFTKFKVGGQNPELRKILKPDGTVDDQAQVYYYRKEFWEGYDFSDERLLHTPVFFNKLKRYLTEITPQVVDSVIKYADLAISLSKANNKVFQFAANWTALYYKEAKMLGRESVYVFLVEKFWTPDQVFWIKDYEVERLRMQARQMKVSLIGNTGKDIKGTNENGEQVALYNIKAPVVLLYMFSYDCENCKKETPKVMKVYNEWKDKGLELFTICIDGETEEWKNYLQKNGMTGKNMFDSENKSNFRAHYWFEVTPGIFVLDKDHKIIATNVGADSLPVLLEKELGKQ